jgi:hypothetical protein
MSEASLVSASDAPQAPTLATSLALIKYVSSISPVSTSPSSLSSDSPTNHQHGIGADESSSPISSVGSDPSPPRPTKRSEENNEYAPSLAIVSLLEGIKAGHQKGVESVNSISPLTEGYESMKTTLLDHLTALRYQIDRELRVFRGLSEHLTPAEAAEEAIIRRWGLEQMGNEVTTLVGVFMNHGGTEDEGILGDLKETVESLMVGWRSEDWLVIPV